MIRRPLILCLLIVAARLILSGEAHAQVYDWKSKPYFWSNANTTVQDLVQFQHIGGGRWRQTSTTIRLVDGNLAAPRTEKIHTEISRGSGEVQFAAEPGTAPCKISDAGIMYFRDYPEIPVPPGIDPTAIRWYSLKGEGRWTADRPY